MLCLSVRSAYTDFHSKELSYWIYHKWIWKFSPDEPHEITDPSWLGSTHLSHTSLGKSAISACAILGTGKSKYEHSPTAPFPETDLELLLFFFPICHTWPRIFSELLFHTSVVFCQGTWRYPGNDSGAMYSPQDLKSTFLLLQQPQGMLRGFLCWYVFHIASTQKYKNTECYKM